MNPERFRRIDELFAAALERQGEARERFLSELEPSLRVEVESLLAVARRSEDFLETPVFHAAATLIATPLSGDAPPDQARFIAGDLVASRYRIVGLLGRGGMGEVYRADDLRLNQPVALKFLAEALAHDGAALARFHREVSVARQISHRNVCRVYDIGEHAGMHFLSMEFIRGEELSSLLKRIGRLPDDKAVDVARQLCAGLAAIHDAGVLHRDLKPANIMLDEHGDVRITDFGIVALSEGVSGHEAMIGTPAYMSPEQRTGGELTTRSDIYALGLVLHEFFTGKRRGVATTGTAPEIDPRVERVIARCLEEDPAKRPASALQVAAALPGGDPLAAALAAGETPSPQMVAASATEGSLRPAIAMALAVGIVAAMALLTWLSGRTMLHRFASLDRSPEVLREIAADLAADAGYARAADSIGGFALDVEVVDQRQRWPTRNGVPAAVTYWYRQSPQPLVGIDNVTRDDPPHASSGMARVDLDSRGRLLQFEGVPPQVDRAQNASVDWSRFFAAAGLDPSRFRRIESQWTPPQHSDARVAWSGVHPDRADLPLRIEAASYRGRPTYFDVIAPWRTPSRQEAPRVGDPIYTAVLVALYFGALALGVLLAWKNLRLGRGDRRGAFRLTVLTFTSRLLLWLVHSHHTATVNEVMNVVEGLQSALYWGCSIGLLHLALEPFVRRRWPEWLIAWSRLLGGDARDPIVGRDMLIGFVCGGAFLVAQQIPALLPNAVPTLGSPLLYELGLLGAHGFLELFVNQLSAAVLFSFILIALVLFFAMVTRNRRAAVGVTWLLFVLFFHLRYGPYSVMTSVVAVVLATVFVGVLARYGVLALIAMMFFIHYSVFYPLTTELTAWYATSFLLQTALLVALTVWGVRTSLGGQKLVSAQWLDG